MTNQNDICFEPTEKQFEAYELLEDNETTELLFGGSISSGKTRLACYWLILCCFKYPGARYLVGRARLQNLKRTTINTLFDIAKEWNIEDEFNFNRQDNVIYFNNGSEIILMDLFQYPSDKDFIKLGSLEITGAVIDEASEISHDVYRILKTRIRYKLKEFGIKPKLLIVSNPTKNWLYSTFYKPSKNSELPIYRKFIQALPHHNHFNSQDYLESLTPESLGMPVYNRLVLGDWDYDDSDYALFFYDDIYRSFHSNPSNIGEKYITIDPAAEGKDTTVITLWKGFDCLNIYQFDNNDTNDTVTFVNNLMREKNVNISHVIIDKTGIGQGIYDLLRGCKGFIANATPFKGENYKMLKDQLFYALAKSFKENKIHIADKAKLDTISQELEAHKMFSIHKDSKSQVTPKNLVKQMIGRSPDIADALMMRMYFGYTTIGKISIIRR